MRVTAVQYEESVVCTFGEGSEIEIIMVCAEGEDYRAEPDVISAHQILIELSRSECALFDNILESIDNARLE